MKKQTFTITGMHCTSCAMNIDGELEDTKGIKCATTNYAKQKTVVEYEPTEVTPEHIVAIIKSVGYEAAGEELQNLLNTK